MGNLLSRIKKIEDRYGKLNEWREKPKFLEEVLNRNFKEYDFLAEDLKFFEEPLEAVICAIELCSICLDEDCETCADEKTCTEVKKRIKNRRVMK